MSTAQPGNTVDAATASKLPAPPVTVSSMMSTRGGEVTGAAEIEDTAATANQMKKSKTRTFVIETDLAHEKRFAGVIIVIV
jgi:hypothetical protein